MCLLFSILFVCFFICLFCFLKREKETLNWMGREMGIPGERWKRRTVIRIYCMNYQDFFFKESAINSIVVPLM